MPISASSKPFLTKPSFEFYRDDVSKNGLIVHWNFSNLNCINYDGADSTISNLVLNGTGDGQMNDPVFGGNITPGYWNGGFIDEILVRGNITQMLIEKNNALTVEWVGRVVDSFPSANAFVNKGDSFRFILLGGQFSFGIWNSNDLTWYQVSSSKTLVQSRTYYITGTYDGVNMTIYVHDDTTGTTKDTFSLAPFNQPALSPTGVNFTANSSFYPSGYQTRSIKFYDRVLSESEIFYNRKYISYF